MESEGRVNANCFFMKEERVSGRDGVAWTEEREDGRSLGRSEAIVIERCVWLGEDQGDDLASNLFHIRHRVLLLGEYKLPGGPPNILQPPQ